MSARRLTGLSPDGHHFMTVHIDGADVALHTWPAGEARTRIGVAKFGHAPDDWYRHHVVAAIEAGQRT